MYRVMTQTELPPISLDGFDIPFGVCEYEWGAAAVRDGRAWHEHAFHAEVLSWHYHDYLGTHAFVQVWDYHQQDHPGQRWQYMLLLHRPTRHTDADGLIVGGEWNWTIRCEYEARDGQRPPTYAEVGADIDTWVQAPDILRFIVE